MEENYFVELNKIAWDVSKKQNLSYISWANAWEMVKTADHTANYTTYETEGGFPFWESKFGIDVKVWVTIKWIEHIIRLPVMDWANQAMKATEYTYKTKYAEKTVNAATTFDINKAIQRALTKALAMHWVGLYVYRWEDLPNEEPVELPEFTQEIFEKFKKTESFKDYSEGKLVIEKKYSASLAILKEVKTYYATKDDWVDLSGGVPF